jgi:signal peptidase II
MRTWVAVVVFLITLACDQGSKAWARSELTVGHPEPVVEGYWEWELAHNDGMAFSQLSGSRVLLTLFAIGALIGLGVLAQRTQPEERLKRLAYALIAGGALGNLVDRVRLGAVTDFVRWRIEDHRWPIFNVADAALLIGAVLLVAEMVITRRRTVRLAT